MVLEGVCLVYVGLTQEINQLGPTVVDNSFVPNLNM